MARLYTRVGDKGETGLKGGVRVPKDDLRIAANGDLDELNATLGVVQAMMGPELKPLSDILERVQHELFILGQEITEAGLPGGGVRKVEVRHVARLEQEIDMLFEPFRAMNFFVLPRGGPIGSHLHLARTVSRRAERTLRTLHRTHPLGDPALAYVNRLSDLLFAMALSVNHLQGVPEIHPDYTK